MNIDTKNKKLKVITEATTLSKAERELTGDDIDKRIEQYQNTIDGKDENILKRKDGKPLTPNYCKEKIRLLKKLKTDGNENPELLKLKKLLKIDNWKIEGNTAINKDFSNEYSVGIVFESNGVDTLFNQLANQIICEATDSCTIKELKIKNKKTNKEKSFNNVTIPVTGIENINSAIIEQYIKKYMASKKTKTNNSNELSVLQSAWNKLDKIERKSMLYYYGDKLENLIKGNK